MSSYQCTALAVAALVLAASFVIYWVMVRKKEGFLEPEPDVDFYHMDGSQYYTIYETENGERFEASVIPGSFFPDKAVYLKIKDRFYVEIYIDGKLETTLKAGTTKIYDGRGYEQDVNGIKIPVLNGIWKNMFEIKNSYVLIKQVSSTRTNQGAEQIIKSMKRFTNKVNTKIQKVNTFLNKTKVKGKM